MDEDKDWIICGRLIGTATGWDQDDTFSMQVYGLKPDSAYQGPVADCVTFDFEKGLAQSFTDNGDVASSIDLIEAVKNCPVWRRVS